ncbi:MAG TPA: glycosyltransferase family 2 protein [Acidobacteriota bacterium]|nr:glycosyltransferase family 2 protein [Acidobacteriota bacterium]
MSRVKTNNDVTTAAFLARNPGRAADITLTSAAGAFYVTMLLGLLFVFVWDWLRAGHFLAILYSFYVFVILFRLVTVAMALVGRPEIVVTPEEIASKSIQNWPCYTILVPLYREPEVAAKIVRYLDLLDYPRDRLEVLLLLESDDSLTRTALTSIPLPCYFRFIDVPDTAPRTKPKACNWGLREAKGEFIVVYDAEDRPDPDQLKKAVIAFHKVPERIICLQAKLSYYNPAQNRLTRWFTIEYAAWFDLYLPGLYRLALPIPLGGTSNHFRRHVLDEIGGWDPYNVAEDCDLGIRLHRMGKRTAMLDTTTWEEANSRLTNWIRQRSRWIKGYIQTHLVHTRLPVRTLRELKLLGTLSFLMSVGGHSLLLLLNPLFLLAAIVYLFQAGRKVLAGTTVAELVHRTLQGTIAMGAIENGYTILSSVTTLLFLANFLFILLNLLGCMKRRLGGIYLIMALASPAYWILISAAAWKGLLQLVRRPHYWEKTDHGLFVEPESQPADQRDAGHAGANRYW